MTTDDPGDAMGYKDPMPTTDLGSLLHRVVTARPTTREEFDEVAAAIGWDPAAAFAELERLGIVAVSGGALSILDPVQALTDTAESALDRAQSSFDEARILLSMLPGLRAGEPGPDDSGMIGPVIRGHEAVWETWRSEAAQHRPRRPGVVMPDAVTLRTQVLDNIDQLAVDFVERDYRMRCILDIEECADERGRLPDWIRRLVNAGVEIRAMADPPGWFYADDEVMGGLPITWGQRTPAGMVILRPSAVLALAAAFYEVLWRAATPVVDEHEEGWEPVLRLLEVGRNDKQIADALGIGLRTVHRRIAEAMDELGATGRFDLGMRWAERSLSRSPDPRRAGA